MPGSSGILTLGIDTGGTFTDAVLYEPSTGRVLASAKALTTYHDLSLGILEAIRKVISTALEHRGTGDKKNGEWVGGEKFDSLSSLANRISFVGLSTTLATNALVEGRGGTVGLILIGYDLDLLDTYHLTDELGTKNFINIKGGHNEDGSERAPLDEGEVRKGILTFLGKVNAFAVSGYFGVRNPAHELRVKELICELATHKGVHVPVTCGHELTSRLDSVRRAMTVVMNARLIPLLQQLIETVQSSLNSLGIHAPLMVVRGDGSLMRAERALEHPIETILSGPAASVVGAQALSGQSTFWMVDMGGTTTDIAYVSEGLPTLNSEGARVGRWKTMVEAIDLHTIGLGGDSRVQYPSVGPERVVPLSLLAHQYPSVLQELRKQVEGKPRSDLAGRFLLLRIDPFEFPSLLHALSNRERLLVDLLKDGPIALENLASHQQIGYTLEQNIRHLISLGVGIEGGFTPTDALHVLGELSLWDREAACFGAVLYARSFGISPESLCKNVRSQVPFLIAKELVLQSIRVSLKSVQDLPLTDLCPLSTVFLETALKEETPLSGSQADPAPSLFNCSFTLKDPIVAVGAPAGTYLPEAGSLIHTKVLIPPYAEVANAVGAVTGLVVERVRVEILPSEVDGTTLYRAHSPLGLRDHPNLEDCIRDTIPPVTEYVKDKAIGAGAQDPEIRIKRKDLFGSSQGNVDDIYLKTELEFIAVGRPSSITMKIKK